MTLLGLVHRNILRNPYVVERLEGMFSRSKALYIAAGYLLITAAQVAVADVKYDNLLKEMNLHPFVFGVSAHFRWALQTSLSMQAVALAVIGCLLLPVASAVGTLQERFRNRLAYVQLTPLPATQIALGLFLRDYMLFLYLCGLYLLLILVGVFLGTVTPVYAFVILVSLVLAAALFCAIGCVVGLFFRTSVAMAIGTVLLINGSMLAFGAWYSERRETPEEVQAFQQFTLEKFLDESHVNALESKIQNIRPGSDLVKAIRARGRGTFSADGDSSLPVSRLKQLNVSRRLVPYWVVSTRTSSLLSHRDTLLAALLSSYREEAGNELILSDLRRLKLRYGSPDGNKWFMVPGLARLWISEEGALLLSPKLMQSALGRAAFRSRNIHDVQESLSLLAFLEFLGNHPPGSMRNIPAVTTADIERLLPDKYGTLDHLVDQAAFETGLYFRYTPFVLYNYGDQPEGRVLGRALATHILDGRIWAEIIYVTNLYSVGSYREKITARLTHQVAEEQHYARLSNARSDHRDALRSLVESPISCRTNFPNWYQQPAGAHTWQELHAATNWPSILYGWGFKAIALLVILRFLSRSLFIHPPLRLSLLVVLVLALPAVVFAIWGAPIDVWQPIELAFWIGGVVILLHNKPVFPFAWQNSSLHGIAYNILLLGAWAFVSWKMYLLKDVTPFGTASTWVATTLVILAFEIAHQCAGLWAPKLVAGILAASAVLAGIIGFSVNLQWTLTGWAFAYAGLLLAVCVRLLARSGRFTTLWRRQPA